MKQKGFTLIELLVVVAIIGILAAVGVVAYNGYVESARKAVAKQNFKNTVRYFANEVAKCDMDSSQKAFNLSCPVQVNSTIKLVQQFIYHGNTILEIQNFQKKLLVGLQMHLVEDENSCKGSDRGGVRSGDGQVMVM